jgi:UDP-glucose 6-dehydrogenase
MKITVAGTGYVRLINGVVSYTITEHLENDANICTRSTVLVGTYAKIEEIILRLKPPPIYA